MSTLDLPTVFRHVDHPEWGRGVALPVAGGRGEKIDLSFESGGRRTLLKRFVAKLQPVELAAADAQHLTEKLTTRRTSTAPLKAGTKKTKGAKDAPAFATFDAQFRFFEQAFPGGFHGEKFEREERSSLDPKRPSRAAALEAAAEALKAEAFQRDPAQVFEAAAQLARTSGFVHQLEGAGALATMKPEHRPAFVAALRELLHGTGDEVGRFDRFVASLQLKDANGTARRVSWPLVTMFAALTHPTEHICVKPTFFQHQAQLTDVAVAYQPTPSGAGYAEFLAVGHATEARLRQAGQAPRDLVDVYSFICLTLGAKPAPVKG